MVRRAAKLFILCVLLASAGWAATHWTALEGRLADAGPAGVAVFSAAFVLLVTGCFPVSVLGFTAGAAYGPFLGLGIVIPAVGVGGVLMLALGRSLLRDPIRRRVAASPRLRALDTLAGDRALRLNLLARLSPFNFGLVCYALAAGRTPPRAYLWGLLGVLPSVTAHVLAGTLVRAGGGAALSGGQDARFRTIVAALGLAAILALAWQVGRLARAAWQQAADQEEGR